LEYASLRDGQSLLKEALISSNDSVSSHIQHIDANYKPVTSLYMFIRIQTKITHLLYFFYSQRKKDPYLVEERYSLLPEIRPRRKKITRKPAY